MSIGLITIWRLHESNGMNLCNNQLVLLAIFNQNLPMKLKMKSNIDDSTAVHTEAHTQS